MFFVPLEPQKTPMTPINQNTFDTPEMLQSNARWQWPPRPTRLQNLPKSKKRLPISLAPLAHDLGRTFHGTKEALKINGKGPRKTSRSGDPFFFNFHRRHPKFHIVKRKESKFRLCCLQVLKKKTTAARTSNIILPKQKSTTPRRREPKPKEKPS